MATDKQKQPKVKTDTKAKASTTPVEAKKTGKYYYGLGRRKTASATVRIYKQAGESVVNGKNVSEEYIHEYELQVLNAPFIAAELDPKDYHFTSKVRGSGPKAQLDAIQLGIARAIVTMDETLKTKLKAKGLMTRDPRAVERKKPGLRKARRAEQFSKR